MTGNEYVGTGQPVLLGAATALVTSMAAVLPGGRSFPGVVKTGHGFPVKAWTVSYPQAKGARLVFRDASGREVASLGTAAPLGPPQVAQPRGGGRQMFVHYAENGQASGTTLAYLIDGRVGFWSAMWGGHISPVPADGQPVVGGLTIPFGQVAGAGYQEVEAFGYAHANVARVVLRTVDGSVAATATLAAGWAGSNLRLWAVPLPPSTWVRGNGLSSVTATAYDSAGHVLGRVQLGSMG